MSLFSFPTDQVITSLLEYDIRERDPAVVKVSRDGQSKGLAADIATKSDLANQFVVFQLSNQLDGPSILESSQIEPTIEGSQADPDVLVALELLSFHLGRDEEVDSNTRATMRLNFGKDESSTDKHFDTAFWSIAAGLNLYDAIQGKKAASKELKSDLHKAFGNRPIEIPGGLGRFSLEVVKHEEPPWWKRIFRFAQSDTAKSLVSVLGFPAITNSAIEVLDELLNRLTDSDPEPLFKSIPMRLALSKHARDAFTGGNPRIRVGSLRQGFSIMARGRDFGRLSESDLLYYPTYGKLVPASVSESDLMRGDYEDPVEDVTYVVFRVGTKSTKLDPTFNFSA